MTIIIFVSLFIVLIIPCIYMWSFVDGIVMFQLNKSAYKKRTAGINLMQRILFIRFKEEIPSFFVFFYYGIVLTHTLIFILVPTLYFYEVKWCWEIVKYTLLFDCVWMIVLRLFFWKSDGYNAYERWITKKRGQNKK